MSVDPGNEISLKRHFPMKRLFICGSELEPVFKLVRELDCWRRAASVYVGYKRGVRGERGGVQGLFMLHSWSFILVVLTLFFGQWSWSLPHFVFDKLSVNTGSVDQ